MTNQPHEFLELEEFTQRLTVVNSPVSRNLTNRHGFETYTYYSTGLSHTVFDSERTIFYVLPVCCIYK
jgi:hypothetical protein